ncbi:MAG: arginyltransferase [Acidiferrobacterales bacterium]
MTIRQWKPSLFLSMPHSCSYLPGHTATTLFVDPQQRVDSNLLGKLARHGFRRSGDFVYRPHCQMCSACVPVRVPVATFKPNRSQKRTWQKNRDLTMRRVDAKYHQEHFELYVRYQRARHPGGSMDEPDPEKYVKFLLAQHVHTHFYEMRLGHKLLGVAVADVFPDGLSAVYTFFEPADSKRSLGIYAVLLEIAEAKSLGLPWLYLGYWIEESPKMSYKHNFRPLEVYKDGHWVLSEA